MGEDKRDKRRHPMQPVADDGTGVWRFKCNKIVRDLLHEAQSCGGLDMNRQALRDYSDEDRIQFAQLIGYSVSGFGELSYVDDRTYSRAASAVKRGTKKRRRSK